jgi:hypothetical protein
MFQQLRQFTQTPRTGACLASTALLALAAGCSGGTVVTLGSGGPVLAFSTEGERVRNINEEASEEYDPTLTDDLLEIYFISDRMGGLGRRDVWFATRASRIDAFGAPELLREASSDQEEASPIISGDGLTLWVGSRREGGQGELDIWRTTRAARGEPWGPPENVAALNSALNDVPRPIGQGGTTIPLASDRDDPSFQTDLASRAGPVSEFDRVEPLAYLWESGASMDDGCLSEDGLLLFFKRAGPGEPGDLFTTWRKSTRDPFHAPNPLAGVNSPAEERDPFLSADRIRFFFSSDRRDGLGLDIYATSVEVPRFD